MPICSSACSSFCCGTAADGQGREMVRAINEGGGDAIYLRCESAWARIIAATVARFGGIDILVNNAGVFSG